MTTVARPPAPAAEAPLPASTDWRVLKRRCEYAMNLHEDEEFEALREAAFDAVNLCAFLERRAEEAEARVAELEAGRPKIQVDDPQEMCKS